MRFDPTSLSNFMLFLAAWGGAFVAALSRRCLPIQFA
jgi:hypothetical protein